MAASNTGRTYYYYSGDQYIYYTGPIVVDTTLGTITGYSRYSTVGYQITGNTSNEGLYSGATITVSQIETTSIPGHYADQMDAPYLIIDTYKRIQLSPWFVNCTCGSLESALAKAKTLVEVIGMNNVKIIKIVPFDQFIKIK